MARLIDKLLDRIAEGGLDVPGDREHWSIRRTYAGVHQKSAGAWTWALHWNGPRDHYEAQAYSGQVGSQWPASVCVKGPVQVYSRYGYSIIPEGV